jgi:pre-60S factor REI1
MSSVHSFFVPDRDYLIDISGLLAYLGEKVVVGNICLYCPGGSREFASVEAVRRHMIDKSHCKLAFETEDDRNELSDYYNFGGDEEAGGDWEDVDDGEEHDADYTVAAVPHPDVRNHPCRGSVCTYCLDAHPRQ